MQMKELEAKHQLVEEKRPRAQAKRSALEIKSIKRWCSFPINQYLIHTTPELDPNKRDVLDWAGRIDSLPTPDRSTDCFEAKP